MRPTPPRSSDLPTLPLPLEVARLIPGRPPGIDKSANVGLWLDRYLVRLPSDKWSLTAGHRSGVLADYVGRWESKPGAEGILRRRQGYQQLAAVGSPLGQPVLVGFELPLLGPLLVDHGRSTATEVSLSFHPMWGVPRIPGSALKGLARAQAELEGWEDVDMGTVFGREPPKKGKKKADTPETPEVGEDAEEAGPSQKDQGCGGLITFYDAVPKGGKFELALDVLTPHNTEWYEGSTDGPVEWKSPVPVTFLTVANTTFVFDLGLVVDFGPGRKVWGNPAVDEAHAHQLLRDTGALLQRALQEQGVGAKTAAGYGYFK